MVLRTQDVVALKQKTGAGIIDCKEALIKSEGDFEKSIDFLRRKREKIFEGYAKHSAAQGSIFSCVRANNKQAYLLALNCETDFVSKSKLFITLGERILKTALDYNCTSIEVLKYLPLGQETIQEAIVKATATFGEKIIISHYESLTGEIIIPYVHIGNRLAVLVSLKGPQYEDILSAGRDIAMQIAAMDPLAINKNQIDPAIVKRELSFIYAQVVDQGFDGDKAKKITQSRLNNFFQEKVLLQQPFIKNNKLTVAEYIKSVSSKIIITDFKRISLSI